MVFIRVLRLALCACLCVAPFAFAVGLPAPGDGPWIRTEAATVALHSISGMAGLFLALCAAAGDVRARAAAMHPVPVAFFLVAFLSAGQALLGNEPSRMVNGLAMHGIGGLWHVDVAILAAGYLATATGPMRRIYAVCGGLAAATAAVLTLISAGEDLAWLRPHAFPGWTATAAILASVPLIVQRGPSSKGFVATGLAVLILGLVAGQSIPALFAVAAAGIGLGCWRLLPRGPRTGTEALRSAAATACVAVLLGTAALLPLVPAAIENVVLSDQPAVQGDAIPSENPIDHVSIDGTAYGKLWSAGWSVKAVLSDIADRPLTLLSGRGWGAFPQVYQEQRRSVPGRAFPEATETSSRTIWSANASPEFHSRNVVIEAMLSLGIPGAFLVMVTLLVPLVFARRRDVPAAAFLSGSVAIVSCFTVPVVVIAPFLALAFSSVAKPDLRRASGMGKKTAAASAAALGGVSLVLLFFCSVLAGMMEAERQALSFEPMVWFGNAPPCRTVQGSGLPAEEVNSAIYRRFVEEGEKQQVPFAWFAERARTAINYACIQRDLADHSSDTALISTSLDMRARLLNATGNFPPILAMLRIDIANWSEDIRRMLAVAPGRTDVVIPYVDWLMAKGDRDGARTAIAGLSPLVPASDPVSLWLKARSAEIANDETAYKAYMTQALRRGIANLIRLRKADVAAMLRDAPESRTK